MKPTIEDLWYGHLAPGPNCGAGEMNIEKLNMLMERNGEILSKELTDQQKALFQKYVDCAEEYICLISSQAFTDGFSLACKLMAEALVE